MPPARSGPRRCRLASGFKGLQFHEQPLGCHCSSAAASRQRCGGPPYADLELARHPAVFHIRVAVPDPADQLPDGGGIPEPGRRIHVCQYSRLVCGQCTECLLDQLSHQCRIRHGWRAARVSAGLGGGSGQIAGMDSAHLDDVFRGGVQLCRRAAGVCFPRHIGTGRTGHRVAQEVFRLRHLLHGFQRAEFCRPDHDLPVFPDSPDGADRHARAGRPETRVA